MYVCICNGVIEQDISQFADKGAWSMRQLPVVTQCRRCARYARSCLQEVLAREKVQDIATQR